MKKDKTLHSRSKVLETAAPLREWEHRSPLGIIYTDGDEERMKKAKEEAKKTMRRLSRLHPDITDTNPLHHIYRQDE